MTTRNERPVPGVGVVVIDQGRLLLVLRSERTGAGQWAVPGGKVRLGERLVEAAAREALEESGLMVEVGEPEWVGESIGPGSPPVWHYTIVDFRAEVVGGELRAGGDAADVRWVSPEELGELRLVPSMHLLVERLRASGRLS